jgi:DNA-binding NtrC family response regulator
VSTRTILIIDDDIQVLETVADLLDAVGFNVIKANDAESAFDILKGFKVSAVLTDLIMPGMSGIGFAQKLTQSQPGIAIVIYTGADIGDFDLSISNIHSVVTKPSSPQILIDTLSKAISEAKLSNQKKILDSSKQKSTKN